MLVKDDSGLRFPSAAPQVSVFSRQANPLLTLRSRCPPGEFSGAQPIKTAGAAFPRLNIAAAGIWRGLSLQDVHASVEDLSTNALRGERVRELVLLTDHRWSSASVSAPPVHLKSPPRSLGRRVCKHVVCGLSGEISVICSITQWRCAPFRSLYGFFLAFISFSAFLLLNLPEFILFHLSCKLSCNRPWK